MQLPHTANLRKRRAQLSAVARMSKERAEDDEIERYAQEINESRVVLEFPFLGIWVELWASQCGARIVLCEPV